jgi:hypothetical protein
MVSRIATKEIKHWRSWNPPLPGGGAQVGSFTQGGSTSGGPRYTVYFSSIHSCYLTAACPWVCCQLKSMHASPTSCPPPRLGERSSIWNSSANSKPYSKLLQCINRWVRWFFGWNKPEWKFSWHSPLRSSPRAKMSNWSTHCSIMDYIIRPYAEIFLNYPPL